MNMECNWRKHVLSLPAVVTVLFCFAGQCYGADIGKMLLEDHLSILDLLIILLVSLFFFFLKGKKIVYEQHERKKAEDSINTLINRTKKYSKQIDQFTLAGASMLTIEKEDILFKKIADTIIEYSDYNRVMISLFKEGEAQREILGYAGLSPELVAIMSSIPVSKPYFETLSQLADPVGQFSFYIPHTKKHILNQDVVQYGEGPLPADSDKWHPQDNLLVNMHDEHGKLIGVMSMDSSKSGLKPVDETVRPLEIFSRLIAQLVLYRRGKQKQEDLQFQLDQYNQFEAFSKITESIANDLTANIDSIRDTADLGLLNTRADSSVRNNFNLIIQASAMAKEHTKLLYTFSKKGDLKSTEFDIVPALEEAVALTRSILPTSIELNLNIQTSEALVRTGPSQFNQIINNLCKNSIEAMQLNGGSLTISLNTIKIKPESIGTPGDLDYGTYAKIVLSDTGSGIDKSIIHQIFDPNFTTKTDRHKGIGLTQAKNLIENCNGRITVNSSTNFGTTFTLYLPLHTEEQPTISIRRPATASSPTSKHVLFVDDDKTILSLATAIFEQLDFTMETAVNPIEALGRFKEDPEKYDLVVTDMTMPNMSGDELAAQILAIRPTMPIILSTGYSDRLSKEEALQLGIQGYYEKPLAEQPFLRLVRELMNRP